MSGKLLHILRIPDVERTIFLHYHDIRDHFEGVSEFRVLDGPDVLLIFL
jgi:hypothetical protein